MRSHGVILAFFEGVAFSFAVRLCSAMSSQRVVYCPEYQKKREVKGRTCCPYTKWLCPNGQHICSLCGRPGHGSEECRFVRPTQAQAPPPPPQEAASSASASTARPSSSPTESRPDPDVAAGSTGPRLVAGFGFKGEGKKAIMGPRSPRLPLWHLQIFRNVFAHQTLEWRERESLPPRRMEFLCRSRRRQRRLRVGCSRASASSRT